MAMETWNEFTGTVLEYTETGSVDDFTATMVVGFIEQGSENPREQMRLSRTIKDVLAKFDDSPLNGRRSGNRKSGIQALSEDAQAEYAEIVSVEVGDEFTTLTLRNDAFNHHTTFSGRKDDDGVPLTSWGDNSTMLEATVLRKLADGYVKSVKGGN